MADEDLEHPLVDGCPPEWANEWGVDEHGLFVGLSVGEVDLRFRWIPPGEFLMGSPDSESGRWDNEGPQHRVRITAGFWLAETPVTQALWERVMGKNPSRFSKNGASRPVENVNWEECQAFIKRLNEGIEELDARLPSEAEWEFACWAGSKSARYGELDAIAWHSGNSGGETHPVRQLQPNPWGLHDMLGNVEEWCADGWLPDAYGSRGALAENPFVPATGELRVLRGGSWFSVASSVRAAYRIGDEHGFRNIGLGFRLALGQGRSPSQET